MSWPTDTEQTLKHRITSLQANTNKLRGMHRPRKGNGTAYSIFQGCNTPKPASKGKDILDLCPNSFDEILQVLVWENTTKAASRARTGCGLNQ